MSEPPECTICQKTLNPRTMTQVGLDYHTGLYTLREDLATQGWFDIGKDCLKTLRRKGELLENDAARMARREHKILEDQQGVRA
jgi:hypothetical protein